jgi:RimJ/RimL family protein N-acetyltransferase
MTQGQSEQAQSQSQPQEQPLINMVGEKVALGPFDRKLLPILTRWENDFEVSIFSGDSLQPTTRDMVETEYDKYNKERQHSSMDFIIYDHALLRPIGMVGLRHIHARHQSAELGILIGEKEYWSKGFGTEAIRLILDYGFSILGLHNIMLTTYSYNERAIQAYTRAGFRMIGRRREAHRWGNKRYDEIIMDCLATEFETPLKRILTLP